MLWPVSLSSADQHGVDQGWHANLSLAFSRRGERTDLRFKHEGPLRIQKPLYPEGPRCCHAVVVHPPGGIAGGDCLFMDISVAQSAHALVTTPSAAKWYGSFDQAQASQFIKIEIDGKFEWLPSETIVFDHASVASDISIAAGPAAQMLGWDLLIFGRHGSGERFASGAFEQTLQLTLGTETIWIDRLYLTGSDPLFDSPIGLSGHNAMATCWLLAPSDSPWDDEKLDAIRQGCGQIAWTRLHPRLLVGRQLGCPIQMQQRLKLAWRMVRQTYWDLGADDLRLWAT